MWKDTETAEDLLGYRYRAKCKRPKTVLVICQR